MLALVLVWVRFLEPLPPEVVYCLFAYMRAKHSVLHMAGTECRAGPRRVLHWDDVGETQKRCSSGLRESPLDEKASSGGPPGELS